MVGVLDLHSEIEIPKLVGAAHEIDGEHDEAAGPGAGRNVTEEGPACRTSDVFDHADRVDTVGRRSTRELVKCAVPRSVGEANGPVVKEVPFVPIRLWRPAPSGRGRI